MKKLPSMQCRTHLMARCGLKFIEQVICLNPARLKSMTLIQNSKRKPDCKRNQAFLKVHF